MNILLNNNIVDWVFDLDNCLYPFDNGLYEHINHRMNQYIIDHCEIFPDQVDQTRRKYINTYGNTLLGLMLHHQVKPDHFLELVHDFPLEPFVQEDPSLIEFIQNNMKGRLYIFTNAPGFYAKKILAQLNILDKVHDIYDIHFTSYQGKPHSSAFEKVIAHAGLNPQSCLFVDDMKKNVLAAEKVGFNVAHIDTSISYKNNYYIDLFIPTVLQCYEKRACQ